MKATLVIPSLNRPEQLLALVRSLERQSVRDFETVIIDQSDTPNEAIIEMARADPSLVYVRLERKSLPNARNVAAAMARTGVLIFVDDDVELVDRFVAAHLEGLADPTVGALAGRITGGYDDGAPDATVVGDVGAWTGKVIRNYHVVFPVSGIDQIPGGNFSVRREVYLALGGFDADGFGGHSIGEETDFSFRLRGAGYRIDYEPRAHLIHLHLARGGCRDDSKVRWTWWHAHNTALLCRRYSPWWRRPVFALIQIGRYAAHALRGMHPLLWPVGVAGTFKGLAGSRYRFVGEVGKIGADASVFEGEKS